MQAFGVVDGRVHAVQRRRQARGARMHDQRQARLVEGQFGGAGLTAQVQVQRQVQATERQALHLGRLGNLRQCQQTACAFDNRPDSLAGRGHHSHLGRAFDLGQQYPGDICMGLAERHVLKMLGMLRRVDAHPHLGLRMGMQERAQIIPGLTFERLFHRVFKIHNHCVGAAGQGLGKPLRAAARHKQRRTY